MESENKQSEPIRECSGGDNAGRFAQHVQSGGSRPEELEQGGARAPSSGQRGKLQHLQALEFWGEFER